MGQRLRVVGSDGSGSPNIVPLVDLTFRSYHETFIQGAGKPEGSGSLRQKVATAYGDRLGGGTTRGLILSIGLIANVEPGVTVPDAPGWFGQ